MDSCGCRPRAHPPGRDRRIRTKREEIRQLRAAKLRVFWIGGKRDLPTWQWLVHVFKHWDAIEQVVRMRRTGPWFYVINEAGLSEIRLDR